MTSMKTVQFLRSSTPVDLRLNFFLPLDLGRPISKKLTSPNDNHSIKRKHDPRMIIKCYQQSNYRSIHHLQGLLLTLPRMGHWPVYLQCVFEMFYIYNYSHFSAHFTINLFYLQNFKTNYGTTTALCMWTNEIKTKEKPINVTFHAFYYSI